MSESPITPQTPDAGPGTSPEAGGGKPLLLLDVDGVLKAFPTRTGRADYTRHRIDGYRIHLHREVAAMVEQLRLHYDIVWFTLWNPQRVAADRPARGASGRALLPHLLRGRRADSAGTGCG